MNPDEIRREIKKIAEFLSLSEEEVLELGPARIQEELSKRFRKEKPKSPDDSRRAHGYDGSWFLAIITGIFGC